MQRPPWLGKLIGALIGWLVLGPVGVVLGLLLGDFSNNEFIVRHIIRVMLTGKPADF